MLISCWRRGSGPGALQSLSYLILPPTLEGSSYSILQMRKVGSAKPSSLFRVTQIVKGKLEIRHWSLLSQACVIFTRPHCKGLVRYWSCQVRYKRKVGSAKLSSLSLVVRKFLALPSAERCSSVRLLTKDRAWNYAHSRRDWVRPWLPGPWSPGWVLVL